MQNQGMEPKEGDGVAMPTAGPSPELKANICSWFVWQWMYPLVKKGNKKALQAEDMYDMNPRETTEHSEQLWNRAVEKSARGGGGGGGGQQQLSVWTILMSALGKEFFLAALYKPVWLAVVLLQVYVLKALVKIAEKEDEKLRWWWGMLLVVAMLVTSTVLSISQHMCFTLCQKVGMKVRSIVGMAVFDKILAMKAVALAESSAGQMLNLVTNDTQKLLDGAMYFHFVWHSVVEMAVVAAFCIWEAGVSAVPGVGLCFMTLPLQLWLARGVARLRGKAVRVTDARVRLVGEILAGIRVVKYNGWTLAFLKQVEELRNSELVSIRKAAFLRASTSTIRDSVTPFATLVTFGTYVALHDGNLNPSKAFTILALFSVFVRVFSIAPTGAQIGGEAMVAVKRLQSILNLPNGDSELDRLQEIYNHDQAAEASVLAIDCTFTWDLRETYTNAKTSASLRRSSADKRGSSLRRSTSVRIADEGTSVQALRRSMSETGGRYTLNDVNIKISKGDLVAVVGTVGSGKSSLLLALMGEMHCMNGRFYTEKGVAYVPQKPWIFNGTVRENIVFGQLYDEQRYRDVVFACALEHDISRFEAGDETEIGERGINLSGGQKARISLARACYSSANVVFLDDPLAAVDVPTAKHLMVHVLGRFLKGRTVVLVTHNKSSLQYCNQVYLMEDGHIRLLAEDEILRHIALQDMTEENNNEGFETHAGGVHEELDGGEEIELRLETRLDPVPEEESGQQDLGNEKGGPEKAAVEKDETNNKGGLTVKEDRVEGVVELAHLVAYLKGAGFRLCSILLVVFLLAQAIRVMVDYWLSAWVDRKYGLKTHVYVIAYAAFAVGSMVFSLARALLFMEATILAAKEMHGQMAEKVFRSPQLFFDQNPVGRIVNRFSKDQALVDELLPFTAQQTADNLIGCLGSIAIVAVLIPWFLFVLPPFVIGFILVQRPYVVVSRELKRLDGISRSPMYEHFAQALAGIISIRAYGVTTRAHTRLRSLIDANHRAFILFVHASRWLGVRLDFLAAMCVTVAALLVVLLRHDLAPGVAGVVLVQSLQLTGFFQYGIRNAAETENAFTSVERIQTYANLPSEANPHTPPGVIPADWPTQGEVEFVDYTMAYREDLPPVLNNLSFKVEPQKKVGILGRTGAGKSSLAAALFRMVENSACTGSILVDGIDIKLVGLDDLRQRISIIPQDPVLFKGTVRMNLDPFSQHSDNEINEAIRRVHLKKKLASGLETSVESNGENFSVGQRQLLCLARALLRRSRVIVMDEATAAVDGETDELIQTTMREVFRDCTVLTIAHRIETVIDSDLVLVLAKGGRIAEFDSPINLLRRSQDQSGEDGVFADMVAQSGDVIARQLMQAAEKAEATRSQLQSGERPLTD